MAALCLVETPILIDKVAWNQSAWLALPAAIYRYMRRVSLEGSGPGDLRSALDQGATEGRMGKSVEASTCGIL